MDTLDRHKIKRNINTLIYMLDFDMIAPLLLENKIFTNMMIEDIKTENYIQERNRKLLNDLCTRGPTAFKKFLNILKQTNHMQAFDILLENEENSNFQSNINRMQESERDSSETDGSRKVEQNSQRIEEVKLATKWIGDNECYKMRSSPRGLCLIINNFDFHGIKETRYGSDRDVKMLDSVFEQLGYRVDKHIDKTAEEMMKIFENFSKNQEHYEVDSCVIIIMSHGDKDIIYGTYGEKIELKKVFKMFNNENCEVLKNKPKLFFIQSCRGEKFDIGVESEDVIPQYRSVKCDGDPFPQRGNTNVVRIPTWTDMLITYCTIEDHKSFRDEIYGSWFIQHLIDVLMRRACDTDLQIMLNEVSRKVSEMNSRFGEKQSVSMDVRGFHFKIYFNPGLVYPFS